MKFRHVSALLCMGIVAASWAAAAETSSQGRRVWLSDLDISKTQQGWGEPRKDKSVDGNALRIAGRTFERGLGTHADSALYIKLAGGSTRFTAMVGLDDEAGRFGTVTFRILADGEEIFKTDTMKPGQPAHKVDVDVTGVDTLILLVGGGEDGINYDHADWADAAFTVVGKMPETIDGPKEEAIILTPKPGPAPRINSAKVFGVRPGSPVLYTIAASGQRPMGFHAEGLPAGLSLSAETGQITGRLDRRGEHKITLIARNDVGEARCTLRLIVGDTIALTPPMGWNSWNCWGCAIDEQKIRHAAEAMVSSGLIHHGWQYINIDDCWMKKLDSDDPVVGGPTRDACGRILTNARFPDMKALTDHIHRLGLKAGIYISPGPSTCQRYEGSWRHELHDAQRFADWGFDYLKYDWCGYGDIVRRPTLEQMKEPYIFMRGCLDRVDRDIVYSLCQYGMGEVWKWGAEVGGNCWRTTGDITDSWGSMAGIGFAQAECSPYASPGHWNDPDMLVVGKVGWGPSLRETHLTPNEQYTHISLWCLLCSPLLIGCDLTQLDEFTMNLLTNDEVLEVNQDPLGRQAGRVAQEGPLEVWAKPMEDGSTAVGLFNRDETPKTVVARWSDLKLSGPMRVRDLWRQKDIGVFSGQFGAEVPRHGVMLLRLFPAQSR
ncbi:MAG TPA: NPCBM/NEW2 domain-containing protein [Sedimentisphaerales bacterium]|nr:NPCBM/NEW2 domain-containing protein [Sedimentisphaerales bacterium]HRS13138.1 NPCBM/NEW2 domain-containing protein [Sedimentisphaerales bacterium]